MYPSSFHFPVLTVTDEKPLLPAKITPASDEEQVWQTAETVNPLLTRDLPRTEAALKFYAVEIEGVLKKLGREDQYVAPLVTADANGSASAMVFAVRTYKQLEPGTK